MFATLVLQECNVSSFATMPHMISQTVTSDVITKEAEN